MMRRTITGVMAIGLPILAGCGSQPGLAGAPTTSQPAEPTGPLVLAQLDGGVGAVRAGSDDPLWSDPVAVAALDGSAVFSVHHEESGGVIVRIDPKTGSTMSSWRLPAAMASVSAVSPGGRWVALTDRAGDYDSQSPRPSTQLVVFDAVEGAPSYRLELSGDVRPEAFSVDGKLVFALDYRGDHYRVQTIELATGARYDTNSRDKTVEREDMHGTAVRGVLNADHTLLATLYRNPGDADEPAFVHVLDLQNGWAYCADLTAPFGTGREGSDRIELSPADTVIVTATDEGRVAEIHIDEVHEATDVPVTVEYRDGAPAPTDSVFGGSEHVIATVG